jgi:hypothetical protein
VAETWNRLLIAFSAEVKNVWKYTSIPAYVFLEWCLIKRWDILIRESTREFPSFRTPHSHPLYTRIRL